MTFSCLDRPGVSSLMKNDKFLMNCDRFVDIGRNRGTRWNTTEKLSDSDQNLVKFGMGFKSSPSIFNIRLMCRLSLNSSTLLLSLCNHMLEIKTPPIPFPVPISCRLQASRSAVFAAKWVFGDCSLFLLLIVNVVCNFLSLCGCVHAVCR